MAAVITTRRVGSLVLAAIVLLGAWLCSDWSSALLEKLNTDATQAQWAELRRIYHTHEGGDAAYGAAAGHTKADRDTAAAKLIMNHGAVLKDIINTSPTTNIRGGELTQRNLQRVPAQHREQVDAFLREVTRRLLGRRPGAIAMAPSAQTSSSEDDTQEKKTEAWPQAATYLAARVQSTRDEKPGRAPDMSAAAAAAMRAVLAELGEESRGLRERRHSGLPDLEDVAKVVA